MPGPVREVSEETFDSVVVEGSRSRPVAVDFWAQWCGPCHQLAPVLERVHERWAGDVDLVKLDIDQAPRLGATYRIQGIPAVKGFRDGAVVTEFTGVQGEPAIERFFAELAPTEADRLARQAATAADGEAEPLLRRALDADPGHRDAAVCLARLLAGRGDTAEASALLARLPPDEQTRRLAAELSLADVEDEDDLDALGAAAERGDADAQLRLGRALASRGEHEAALQTLLTAVGQSATRDEARAAVVEVFELLGDDDPLVRTYRPRLAAALF